MSSVSNITSLSAVQTGSNQQSTMPTATIALPHSSNAQVIPSRESIQTPQQTSVMKVSTNASTAHITIPPGSVLARNQSGQLLIVNNSTINSQQQSATVNSNAVKTVATIAQSQSNTVSTVKVVPTTTASLPNATVQVSTASPQTSTSSTSSVPMSQDDIVNVSKCRNFLTTLIKLASTGGQSPSTVSNVKKLVQNLIDNKIKPEHFTQQLQVELNSAPQPYLVPFLKRSLPLLRRTMMQQSTPAQQTTTTITSQPPARVPTATDASKLSMNAVRRPVVAGTKVKPINSVPDIKLPRYTSSPTPQRQDPRFAPASQGIVHRSPHAINRPANQKWAGAAGNSTSGGTFKDDDDINDVASMAGVNLSEESARILATNSTVIGSQIRSCNDSAILQSNVLLNKIKQVVSKHPHIQKLGVDFDKYLALAVETRLKDVLEKVSLVAYHRTINFKESNHYTACQDVKSQLKFLLQLDQIERKRHDEMERAVLLRAIKSRSKNEDPEQLRLKQKAKEMQQAEMEKLQIRNADETARIAIGPRKKKPKLATSGGAAANGETDYAAFSSTSSRQSLLKPRLKRVNLRDLLFVLETEKEFCKSNVLYSSYLK